MGRRSVIIANTGTPSAPTPEAVRIYLRQFLSDPRIRPINPLLWKVVLNACILPRRSVRSAAKYERIWTPEGSPLAVGMASLAARLQQALSCAGEPCEVRAAMSYGVPSVAQALDELREAGCQEVVAIPLYPQSAHSTTSVVVDAIDAALAGMGWSPALRLVEGYCERDDYVAAVAGTVLGAGFDPAHDALLATFHSVPMKDIAAGDTYGDCAHATAQAVARTLGLADSAWRIGFQCRFDRSRAWLGPSTSKALEGFPAGRDRLFVVAPNFSIDCLETLLDIDVELRERFAEGRAAMGTDAVDFVYVPCLNDADAHVELLKRIVLEG